MMQRRHLENAPSRLAAAFCHFEYRNLQHYGQRLQNKYAADERQKELLLRQDRDRAERSADRQTPDIAHENLGGRAAIPEKSEPRADHRSAKYREFRRSRIVRQV